MDDTKSQLQVGDLAGLAGEFEYLARQIKRPVKSICPCYYSSLYDPDYPDVNCLICHGEGVYED